MFEIKDYSEMDPEALYRQIQACAAELDIRNQRGDPDCLALAIYLLGMRIQYLHLLTKALADRRNFDIQTLNEEHKGIADRFNALDASVKEAATRIVAIESYIEDVG